jgi:hypothetical protein
MGALADSNVTAVAKLNELQEAARARKIELSIHQVTRGDQIATAIDTAHASGATALNVLASPMLIANRQLIIDRVAALHLPVQRAGERILQGKLIGGEFCYCPGLAETLKKLTRPVFCLSNHR